MKEKLLQVAEILRNYDIECGVIPMREGNVFTIEPTNTSEKINLGLEDDIIVRKERAELLSHPQKEIIVI